MATFTPPGGDGGDLDQDPVLQKCADEGKHGVRGLRLDSRASPRLMGTQIIPGESCQGAASDSVVLGWGPRSCISNWLPGGPMLP